MGKDTALPLGNYWQEFMRQSDKADTSKKVLALKTMV